MFRNPLYYFPVEANLLYHAEKGSKEYKKLAAEIVAKTDGMYVNDDEVFRGYTAKIKRRLIAVFVFAVVGFVSFSAMQITDKIDSDADLIFALFFCVGMLSCIITIFLSIFVVRLRRKLVQLLLKDYTPVCEEFGEQVLREIGILCLDTFSNRDNIEYILEEEENGRDFCGLAACICILCLEVTKDSDITQFDEKGSAVCPHCGEKALIGKAQCISDNFLKKLHRYASAAKAHNGSIPNKFTN